ncbi:MAG: hypothetical protein ACM3QY_03215 [Candidatus Levyibacteriota bacterium]
MQATIQTDSAGKSRYARCIDASRRIRWEIERDVIRGRQFDLSKRFLPNGLSRVDELGFLTPDERRFLTQVQGRSYANIFGLVERFIAAMVVDVSRDYLLGDQVALEALVRFTDEEIKHQEMFRRIERMLAAQMPAGYTFVPEPNAVARAVLSKSLWAGLGLTCHIELFVQLHYRESISDEQDLCPLWKDVFLFHWKEESQHAILDELEWVREDAKLSKEARDAAVDDLIALVGAVDGILQAQAKADAAYFAGACGRALADAEREAVAASVLRAYRWQYIVSGVRDPRFGEVLGGLIDAEQGTRIQTALAPLVQAVVVQ